MLGLASLPSRSSPNSLHFLSLSVSLCLSLSLARIVSEVVGDPELFAEWKDEMRGMAGRIKEVRAQLVACLKELDSSKNWDFITEQIGMFSYTGMTTEQVANMTNKHHVYMTKDGRISLAGLSSGKVEYLANAIVDSFQNC